MNRYGITFKRILTGVLASAMILTATPSYAFAVELTDEPVVETEAAAEVTEAGATNEGDVIETEEPVYNDELQGNAARVTVVWDFDDQITLGDTTNVTEVVPGYWYVDQEDQTEEYEVNKTSFTFKLTLADHYAPVSVTAKIGDDQAVDLTATDGVYTVSGIPEDPSSAVTATITAVAGEVMHTVTLTNNIPEGKGTFTAGEDMTPTGEDNKYSVSEADGYSFTISGVADHYTPKVEVGGVVQENPTPAEGVYSYDIAGPTSDSALVVGVTQETQYTLSLETDSADNAKLMISTKANPGADDFVDLTSENNKFYKGDKVFYKAVANEGRRLASEDPVKIGSEAQTKVSDQDYYEHTFGEANTVITVDTVAIADVNFTLTGVGTLKYKVGSEDEKSLTITAGKGSITVDAGSDVFITGITAAAGYDVQEVKDSDEKITGYNGVTVKNGTYPISYNAVDANWLVGTIAASAEVSVDVKKEQSKVTVTDAKKAVNKLYYFEATKIDDKWQLKGDSQTATFAADGTTVISIDKGNAIFIDDLDYVDGDDTTFAYGFKQGEKELQLIVLGTDIGFLTDAYTDATGALAVSTAVLDATQDENCQVSLTNPHGDNEDIKSFTIDSNSLKTVLERSLVKRETDLKFTITPADGKAIKAVKYTLGESTEEYVPAKTGDNEWTIYESEGYIEEAVIAGGLNITAEVGAENVAVTFNKDANATIKYQQYKVTTPGGVTTYTAVGTEEAVTFAEEDTTKSVDIKNGNVIAVSVIPNDKTSEANGYVALSDSVKFDGVVKIPLAQTTGGIPAGKYLITPIEPASGVTGTNVVAVTTYQKQSVAATEVKWTENKDLTATTLTAGVEDGISSTKVTTGGDIEFTVALAAGMKSFYADITLAEASYGEGTDKQSLKVDEVKDGSGNITGYKIAKAEVEKAVKAGKAIDIAATAEKKVIKEATVTFGDGITKVYVSAYASKADYDDEKDPVNYATFDESDKKFEFQTGNYLVVCVKDGLEETDFVRVKEDRTGEDDPIHYGYGNTDFTLGNVSENETIEVSKKKLAVADVTVEGLPSKPYAYTVEGIIDPDDLDPTNTYVDPDAGSARMEFNVKPVEAERNYKLIPDEAAYTINSGTPTPIKLGGSQGKYHYDIPFGVLAEAAFAGGPLKISVGVEEAGYKKQEVVVKQGYDKIVAKAKVAGESVQYSGGFAITYGADAEFTITGKDGYKVTAVRYAPAMIIDSLDPDAVDSWLLKWKNRYVTTIEPDKDGVVSFTIDDIEEPIYMYAYVEVRTDYVLYVGEYSGYQELEEVKSGDTINAYYNVPMQITLRQGLGDVNIGDPDAWTVKATVPIPTVQAEPQDVTNLVFATIAPGDTSLTFSGANPAIQGKTVTVEIESKTSDAVKKTIIFKVSKPVTGIAWPDGMNAIDLTLGVDREITLKTRDGFDKDSFVVALSGTNSTKYIVASKSEDGTKLTFSTVASKSYDLLDPDPDVRKAKVRLEDAHDSNTVIAGYLPVNVSVDQVKKADLSSVKVVPGTDALKFDFSKVNGEGSTGRFDTETDGLYYVLNATQTTDPKNSDFEDKTNILVPATAASYELKVAKDGVVVAATDVKYDVSVGLVQVKDYNDGIYAEDNLVSTDAKATKTFTEDVEMIKNGVFATKLTFNKNKDKSVAKIYSTMGDVVLGTVCFPDAAKGVPVTVQRLKKVDVLDKSGKVVLTTDNPGFADTIRIRNSDNAIIFNPSRADRRSYKAGSYSIIAYAVEPEGVDVTVKYGFTVYQGINVLEVSVPRSIYKAPGKAASVKANVSYYPDTKPLPVKKVTWSLSRDEDGNIPYSYPGVTIKNGTVSVAKDVEIPEEGIEFYVVATAADYATHTDKKGVSDAVSIHSQAISPSYVTIGYTEIKPGKKYYTNELSGLLYAYDANYEEIDASFAVSGLNAWKDENKVVGGANASKATVKDTKASITVTSEDGSKLKTKFEFYIQNDPELALDLRDAERNSILDWDGVDGHEATAENDHAPDKYLYLHVNGQNGGFIDHTATFSKIKKVRVDNDENGAVYTLLPTDNVGTITIKNKAITRKDYKGTVITVTSTKITTQKTAAYKITAENKYDASYDAKTKTVKQTDNKGNIFGQMYYDSKEAYEAAGSFNKVTYTVKNGSTLAANQKVLISTDDYRIQSVFDNTGGWTKVVNGEYEATTDAEGKLVVDYIKDSGRQYILNGNYSFTLTPIDDDGNAIAKTSTFKFKAVSVPKAKVAVKTTTLNKFDQYQSMNGFSTQNNIVFNDKATTAKFTGNLLGTNIKGQINKFATVFATTGPGTYDDGYLTCIRAPKGYDPTYTPATDKKGGSAMVGYVEYSWTNLDGTTGTALVKVTAKPDNKKDIEKYNQ